MYDNNRSKMSPLLTLNPSHLAGYQYTDRFTSRVDEEMSSLTRNSDGVDPEDRRDPEEG